MICLKVLVWLTWSHFQELYMHVKKVASSTEIQLRTETRTVRDIIFSHLQKSEFFDGKR